jgi:two-component system, LytTR family, sensor kinase
MITDRIPNLPRWRMGIALAWFGLGLFDATQTVTVMHSEGMHHAWLKLFAVRLLVWLPWALATPFVLQLGRRFPPVQVRPYAPWLAHIAACATIGLTVAAWTAWLYILLNPYAESPPPSAFVHFWLDSFNNGILSSLVLYAVVLIVQYTLDSRERLTFARIETARLNEQLSQTQLRALRRQIEPHFLFNSLNAVAGLVREGRSDAAVNMIAALSNFLRRTLNDSTRQEVPLQEELEFVQNYLDIQKARFADRLELSVDVPGNLYPAQVPNLILQPLVENAVKHGIAKCARGGAIRITAAHRDGMLSLRVCNDGPSLHADWERSGGIGISNVRTRLQSLYGDAGEFRMHNQESGGVEVLVCVPLRNCPTRS